MTPKEAWTPDTNFVEIGAKDGAIAASLVAWGFGRVLTVAGSLRGMEDIAARQPSLAAYLTYSTDRRVVRRNNADVLILSNRSILRLWNPRNWRHARQVVWIPRTTLFSAAAIILCLAYMLAGRLQWNSLVRLGDGIGRMAVFGVRHRRTQQRARRYVPRALGVAGFLKRLGEQGVRYAVLRWFESLPNLPPGEDLDLLVDDEHLEALEKILAEGPGIQPVDVYSVTGLPGSEFGNMPYFPPYLAEAILSDARLHGDLCWVPCPEHHFLSLAYHALYHKGERSGLSDGLVHRRNEAEHDYAAVLRRLADDLDIDIRITLRDLDQYLTEHSWRPPHDMLTRLAANNRWVTHLVSDRAAAPEDAGLAVFVVRRAGLNGDGLAKITSMLKHEGFEILVQKVLAPRESQYSARCIRGGNWGRGPWRVSGGPPAAVVVTYDPEPVKPSSRQRRQFPGLTNARVLVKKKIRDAFNDGVPADQQCNVLHSSDNGHQAMDYVQILIPETAAEIQERVASIRDAYATSEPVLKRITRYGRRAKIELIELDGQPAVKKTFKACQDRYRQSEAASLQQLSPLVSEVPPLLRVDHHSLVIPYYEDVLQYKRSSGKLFPLSAAKEAVAALRKVYEAGYALIDAHVENVLVDRREGLKLIDFEFCHRYARRPPTFEHSYDIAGCPADFTGNLPDGGSSSYARGWQPYIGLGLKSLLNDPVWLQHLKRSVYYVAHLPRFLPRRVRHYYRCWRERRTACGSPNRAEFVSEQAAPVTISQTRSRAA